VRSATRLTGWAGPVDRTASSSVALRPRATPGLPCSTPARCASVSGPGRTNARPGVSGAYSCPLRRDPIRSSWSVPRPTDPDCSPRIPNLSHRTRDREFGGAAAHRTSRRWVSRGLAVISLETGARSETVNALQGGNGDAVHRPPSPPNERSHSRLVSSATGGVSLSRHECLVRARRTAKYPLTQDLRPSKLAPLGGCAGRGATTASTGQGKQG
jgi:hypothetical protein